MGFRFPAFEVELRQIVFGIAHRIDAGGDQRDQARAKAGLADLIPSLPQYERRGQRLKGGWLEPRRAGLGLEPFHLLVLLAMGREPA